MGIEAFKEILRSRNTGFSVFYNSDSSQYNANLFYFSGYKGLGALIVPANQQPFLIAPQMEFEKAGKSNIGLVYSMEKKKFFE